MTNYASYAPFYDLVMAGSFPDGLADPVVDGARVTPDAVRVLDVIRRYRPDARSLIEFGCGTGTHLADLKSIPALTGIDLSPHMLTIARHKVPEARFIEADMSTVDLAERFDVVTCMYDTLNHLPRFELWKAMFERAHAHLEDHGLFIFDVYTIGELRRLVDAPPSVRDLDGSSLIAKLEFDGRAMAVWDVRIFERQSETQFKLHHERIQELGVDLARIKDALVPSFELLEEADPRGDVPSDESMRAHFVFRKLPTE
jgi:SAM-dependent methyltransferase